MQVQPCTGTKNEDTHTREETVKSKPSQTPATLLAHANYLSQDGSAAFVEFFEFCIKHGHYIRAEFGVVLRNGRELHQRAVEIAHQLPDPPTTRSLPRVVRGGDVWSP